MQDARGFVANWLVTSVIFYFLPLLFPGLIATGNVRLTPFLASIISAFLLSLLDASTMPTFNSLKIKLTQEWQWMLIFLFTNILGVWLIARYADLTGFGVANAWIAVGVGIVVNVGQWAVWKATAQPSKRKK
jgi:uncharacterized membrane protein YvlD (DUF360 family)